MNEFTKMVIGGIAVIAGVYIALGYSKSLGYETKGFTRSYAKINKVFQTQPADLSPKNVTY